MKLRQLAEIINQMNPEQQDSDAMFYDEINDEFFALQAVGFYGTPAGILDAGHPFLKATGDVSEHEENIEGEQT